MRPPVHRARVVWTSSFQPGGAGADSKATPGGASITSPTVACGGRSFGVSKRIVDVVSASTYVGEIVTCARALPGAASAMNRPKAAVNVPVVRAEQGFCKAKRGTGKVDTRAPHDAGASRRTGKERV